MPLFEFRCLDCSSRFSQLVGMTADSSEPACPKCGSRNVSKLVSRFSRAKGEDESLDDMEDALTSAGDDPRSVSRMLKDMGRQMGDEGDEDVDEFLEEAEREAYDGPAEEEEEF